MKKLFISLPMAGKSEEDLAFAMKMNAYIMLLRD